MMSMLKTITLVAFLPVFGISVHAQSVVDWKFSSKKIADKTYEVHLTATVDEPWHIYSQSTPKGGPLPTTISFTKNPIAQFSGRPKEVGEMEMYHDNIFDVDVYSYASKVDFVQIVKLKSPVKTNISGSVQFMACTKEQCLTPQKLNFNIKLD